MALATLETAQKRDTEREKQKQSLYLCFYQIRRVSLKANPLTFQIKQTKCCMTAAICQQFIQQLNKAKHCRNKMSQPFTLCALNTGYSM